MIQKVLKKIIKIKIKDENILQVQNVQEKKNVAVDRNLIQKEIEEREIERMTKLVILQKKRQI